MADGRLAGRHLDEVAVLREPFAGGNGLLLHERQFAAPANVRRDAEELREVNPDFVERVLCEHPLDREPRAARIDLEPDADAGRQPLHELRDRARL
jgi:hypothetical protein